MQQWRGVSARRHILAAAKWPHGVALARIMAKAAWRKLSWRRIMAENGGWLAAGNGDVSAASAMSIITIKWRRENNGGGLNSRNEEMAKAHAAKMKWRKPAKS